MKLARLYGRETGNGSLAVVTRGFERALKQADAFAGFYGIDTAHGYAEGEIPDAGSNAPHGIYTGPLGAVGVMFEAGRHKKHWVMIAPNSDQLPLRLLTELSRYQKEHDVTFMAPSLWASLVVERFLGHCIVVPHGVMPEFHPRPERAEEMRQLYQAGEFRVVHFSTSDRQRKGTLELLQAWALLNQHGTFMKGAQLMCVLDPHAKLSIEALIADGEVPEWSSIQKTVKLTLRADFGAVAMSSLLTLSHVVCQPSRGEGFGLIPLEALCCGTPVIATNVTGHSEYLMGDSSDSPAGGAVIVATGELGPIDDLPGSRAPTVTPEAIADALYLARANWPKLQRDAQEIAAERGQAWSWEASLRQFVTGLKA